MVNHPSSVVHDRNLINIFIVKLILHLYTQSIRSLMKRPLFLSRSLNRFWPPFPLHDMKFFYVDPCSRMNWLEMKISLTYKKVKEPSCTVMKSLFYPANYLSKLVIPILLVCKYNKDYLVGDTLDLVQFTLSCLLFLDFFTPYHSLITYSKMPNGFGK